jgi:predicted enzyme related to lactoylglutathione lyase
MSRVVHSEIQADDLERAVRFYRDVFGWKIEKWQGEPDWDYWTIITAGEDSKEPGISGGLLKRPAKTPPQEHGTNAYVCTVGVGDFDETAKRIGAAGGSVALPKFAIPGVAWQGYFIDTEGNTFGIQQPDKSAR